MNVLYGILALAVIIGLAILWGKLKSAAWKAANQKILYKSEYREGQLIVSAPLIFETAASVSEIIHELTTHVSIAELPLGFNAAVYQSSFSTNRITYAFGNKLVSKTFEAEVVFTVHDGQKTKGIFKMLNWTERDGLIVGQDIMAKLKKQIQAAFTAADTNKFLKGESQNE